jgi:hypothetical protein
MISRAATLVVAAVGRGLSAEVIARGTRSPMVVGMAAPDPVLRYLALLNALPPEGAPGFGSYTRTARVVMLRANEADVRPAVGAA